MRKNEVSRTILEISSFRFTRQKNEISRKTLRSHRSNITGKTHCPVLITTLILLQIGAKSSAYQLHYCKTLRHTESTFYQDGTLRVD